MIDMLLKPSIRKSQNTNSSSTTSKPGDGTAHSLNHKHNGHNTHPIMKSLESILKLHIMKVMSTFKQLT